MDFAKAKEEADRLTEQKAQGALGAAALSPAVRVALEEALTLLAKHEGTRAAQPSRLVEIVRDYTTASATFPAGATLSEAARYFAQRHPANMARKTVTEAAAEFIADRRRAGCSEVHLHDLEVRLTRQFAPAFAPPIASVEPVDADYYQAFLELTQAAVTLPTTQAAGRCCCERCTRSRIS